MHCGGAAGFPFERPKALFTGVRQRARTFAVRLGRCLSAKLAQALAGGWVRWPELLLENVKTVLKISDTWTNPRWQVRRKRIAG